MRNTFRLAFVVLLLAGLAACTQVAPKGPALQTSAVNGGRTLTLSGTTSFQATGRGTLSGAVSNELPPFDLEGAVDQAQPGNMRADIANRLLNRIPAKAHAPFSAPEATDSGFAPPSGDPSSGETLGTTSAAFAGLNHVDQRTADGGNQFSVEPPDQGLCVGDGHVIEAVNDVVRVFGTDGNPQGPVYSLNQFFGYYHQIDRNTISGQPKYGPFVTDPSCVYSDGHFYLTVLTLEVSRGSGQLTGTNHLDIAVSKTSDPSGDWNIYKLDVTKDGASCPCLGDYPHIATNADGLYITTDSFPFYATPRNGGYNGAWVYAIDKAAMTNGEAANVVAMPMVDDQGLVGYSVAPALSPGDSAEPSGTEYFLSATTVFEASGNEIVVWALDGTDTITSHHPHVTLSSTRVGVGEYGDPIGYQVPQKSGDVPLADALNAGLFGAPPSPQAEAPVGTNDSGMKQTVFVNGHLYGALTTAADNGAGTDGGPGAGIAWYDVTPGTSASGSVSATLSNSGVVAPDGTNLIFPAMTVNTSGQGVIAATQVGPDDYPTAVAIAFSASAGAGDTTATGGGVGPQDGFTGYFIGGNDPRWGDYGASVVDDSGNLWVASEAINQTCDYQTYVDTNGTCPDAGGATRTALANWATQIGLFQP